PSIRTASMSGEDVGMVIHATRRSAVKGCRSVLRHPSTRTHGTGHETAPLRPPPPPPRSQRAAPSSRHPSKSADGTLQDSERTSPTASRHPLSGIVQLHHQPTNRRRTPISRNRLNLILDTTNTHAIAGHNVRPGLEPIQGRLNNHRRTPHLHRRDHVLRGEQRTLLNDRLSSLEDRIPIPVLTRLRAANASHLINAPHSDTHGSGGRTGSTEPIGTVNATCAPQPNIFRSAFVKYRSPVGFENC